MPDYKYPTNKQLADISKTLLDKFRKDGGDVISANQVFKGFAQPYELFRQEINLPIGYPLEGKQPTNVQYTMRKTYVGIEPVVANEHLQRHLEIVQRRLFDNLYQVEKNTVDAINALVPGTATEKPQSALDAILSMRKLLRQQFDNNIMSSILNPPIPKQITPIAEDDIMLDESVPDVQASATDIEL